jgi:hypothetical protein
MEPTKENLEYIYDRLFAFDCFGLPKTQKGFAGYATAICRFLQDQPHKFDKEHENGWTWQQTLDALIEGAMRTFEKLPMPAHLLEFYGEELKFSSCVTPEKYVKACRWLYDHPGKRFEHYDEALYNYEEAAQNHQKDRAARWAKELGIAQEPMQ